ncbi:hypothetical protein LOD99_4022 [Oopsacas minuta]|uniref:Uncharacterized protein n=1 Tax=Oopsacas minuta TaxID=111878 RepID=A0AAV7JX83_9METZ|nr:hypothetical protein LOD99_4022 [Oopsacas minuta]
MGNIIACSTDGAPSMIGSHRSFIAHLKRAVPKKNTIQLRQKGKMIWTDVAYLADIFEKLNIVNKQLQGNNTTLIQAKGVVLSFLSKLTLFRQNIVGREFGQLPCLSELAMANNNIIRDDNIHIYCSHVDSLSEDLLIRFKDLTELVIPNFVINPFRTNIETLDPQFQEEFIDL